MSKIILHIDLNTFFVRCEELVNPTLIGKPVIIGHSGRGGIVSTCSYEARKYGVHSGQPTFKALELCPNAIVIPGHYELYSRKSKEFFNFVKQYSPIIEKASIDECYVDMTKQLSNVKDVVKYLEDFQNKLLQTIGLKCSIGVAPTKFLAKMASDMKKPMGITIIRRKDVRKMLDPLPISSFYGIGKKTAPRLEAIGIKTIGDLAKLVNEDNLEVKNAFGKFYYVIKDWINGYGSDEVDVEPWDPKSIGHSTTFIRDSSDFEEIKGYLRDLSKEVSDEAKQKDKIGSNVQLVLKTNDFKMINRSVKLNKPTNDFETIFNEASILLEKNLNGQEIRLCGVTLQNLIYASDYVEQLSIFDNFDENDEKNATRDLIRELNRRMKSETFMRASDILKEKKHGR
ncbi:MAG: DNA polymerase IV [Bacilli bacterium]|nr:DNA polymerase IV [Bacilli bacterium]MBR0194517.1 DNA polymerase IV [Bacilli bacterium]MBR0301855.1 DNA polymerase IV [Bacilli bacterium]